MCMYTACLFSDVKLNATKGGMARVVEASVFALMVAVVIMSLVHVTVLQDGRCSILFTDYLSHSTVKLQVPNSRLEISGNLIG